MGDDRLQTYFSSLPVGYRFEPSDAELVIHYLRNKVLNKPLPLNRILETNVYGRNPDELHDMLPNYGEKTRYYLTPRNKKISKWNASKSFCRTGYWKPNGTGKEVLAGNVRVGTKTTLVFYQGTHKEATKTNWMMHEYTLFEDDSTPRQYEDKDLLNEWVLCKIYYSTRFQKKGDVKPILAAPGDIVKPEDEERVHVEEGSLVEYQPDLVETGVDQEIVLDSTFMDKSLEEFWLKEEDIFFPTSGQNGEDQGIGSESIQMNKNNQEEEVWLKEEDILVPVSEQGENVLPIQDQSVESVPMENSSTNVEEQREEQLTGSHPYTWQPSYHF